MLPSRNAPAPWLLCSTLFVVTACQVPVAPLDQHTFACRSADECAEGFDCIDGKCQPEGTEPSRDATSRPDLAAADVPGGDIAQPDLGLGDASAPEVGAPDTGTTDASATDAAMPDTGAPDTGMPDVSLPDTNIPDTSLPDTAAQVVCMLQSGDWSFNTPVPVANVNSGNNEGDPVLSADGLTLYFLSDRPGGLGSTDVYSATRPDLVSDFGAPSAVSMFNTASTDTRVSFTLDELEVYISTDRPGGPGDSGTDIWFATRASTGDAFGAFAPLPVVSAADRDEWDVTISPDGLRIYFAPWWDGAPAGQDIFMATRAARGDDFSTAVSLTSLNSPDSDNDQSFTFDELIVLFGSSRPGGQGAHDIWYASRASIGDDFGAAVNLSSVNSADTEGDPFLSGNGCELYFSSGRAGGSGGSDIWVARYQTN